MNIEEIKARAEQLVKLAENPYCTGPVALIDGVKNTVPALISEVERLTLEKAEETAIKEFNYEMSKRKDTEIATLKKTLELAKSNMAYIATTRDICKVCRCGCKESRVHCAKFEWQGIQHAQEQEANNAK